VNTIENPPIEDTVDGETSSRGLITDSTGPVTNPSIEGEEQEVPTGNDNPPIIDSVQESALATDTAGSEIQNPPI